MWYYRAKIIGSLTTAFLLSFFLKENFFLFSTPKINTQAVATLKNFPAKITAVFVTKKVPETKKEKENKPTPMPIEAVPWTPVSTQAPTPTTRPNQPTPTNTIKPTEYISPTSVPTEPEPTPTSYKPPVEVPTQPPSQPNTTLADFGKCLTSKGMVMYTQPGCSACTSQKKTLGAAAQYVTEVNCPEKTQVCGSVGIRFTPSWTKNNQLVRSGSASIQDLGQIAGCQVP